MGYNGVTGCNKSGGGNKSGVTGGNKRIEKFDGNNRKMWKIY